MGTATDSGGNVLKRPARILLRLLTALLIAVMPLLLVPAVLAQTSTIPAGFFTVVDQNGANDPGLNVNGQNDLSQMGRDDSDPNIYKIFWSWDSTGLWTGNGQTGDACALFDSDGDGFVNFAICGQVTNTTASVAVQPAASPYAFSCNDARNDRCGNPDPVTIPAGAVVAGVLGNPSNKTGNLITATDPFGPGSFGTPPGSDYPNDASLQVNIAKSFLPAGSLLVNVCSYPSAGNGGNNNPFDCITTPGGGFLVIKKVVDVATTDQFTFTVSPVPANQPSTYTIQGGSQTAPIGLVVGNNTESVTETVPSGWSLSNAVCTLSNGTATGTKSGNVVSGISIQSGLVTTCTFTNTKQQPALTLLKEVSTSAGGPWSSSVTVSGPATVYYRFTATNAGNVPLSGPLTVSDPVLSGKSVSVDCSGATLPLAPGASTTCVASYSLTQADIDAGNLVNTAKATATYNGQPVNSNESSATVNVTRTPAIDVEKEVSVDGGTTWLDADDPTGPSAIVGEAVQFRFTVKNVGNVTLNSIDLADSILDVDSCTIPATLAPNATFSCTVETTAVADQHSNTATASGNYGGTTYSDTDKAHYYGAAPAIDVEKYVSVDDGATWVDADSATGPFLLATTQPQFKFVVENTGNVPLSSVSLSDPSFDLPTLCSVPTTLAVDQVYECIITGTWQAGQHLNTAKAEGSFAASSGTTAKATDTDDANYYGAAPNIDVEKYVSVNGGTTWEDADSVTGPYLLSGTNPQFKFVVKNTGNVELSDVTVTDPDFPSLACAVATLAPNAEQECIITGAWAEGQHTNTATAEGKFSGLTYTDTDAANYFGAAPAIDVEKLVSVDGGATWVDADSATGPFVASTTDPQFKFVVENTGNVALSGVSLSDSDFTLSDCSALTGLAVDEVYECVITRPWQAGQHSNTAEAKGSFTDANGANGPVSDEDEANYYGAAPAIDLEKYVSVDGGQSWEDADGITGPYLLSGTNPQFKFVVTNTGNVDLTDVTVTDPDFPSLACAVATLAPNAEHECTITGTWQEGQHTNSATASGTYGGTTSTDTDDANYFGAAPAIAVEKLVSVDDGATWVDADSATGPYLLSGTDPQFKFVVKNTGNVELTDVVVTDPDFTLPTDCSVATLAVGAEHECTVTGAWAEGQHTNTAKAEGSFADDAGTSRTVDDTDSANYFGAVPDIDVEKYVSVDGGDTWEDADGITGPFLLEGTDPQFKFVVKNTGNVTVGTLILDDTDFPDLGGCTIPTSLPPGEDFECVVAGTWAAGQHENTATVSASFTDANNDNSPVGDTDDAHYYGAAPAIDVEKYVSVDGGANWLDADSATGPFLLAATNPQFKFVVKNKGNVALSGVSLSDTDFTLAPECTVPTSLAVDQIYECIITRDWQAGQHTNTARAEGSFTDANGANGPVSDTDDANYFGATPAIDVEKYVSVDSGDTWEDADGITGPFLLEGTDPQFKFVVKNTGNVALDNVSLSDTTFNPLDGCTVPTPLAVNQVYECIVTGEWAAGQHSNTATASTVFGGVTYSDEDKAHYFGATPGIEVKKYVSVDGGATWADADSAPGPYLLTGTDPQFKFVVTNTGNVALSNVSLSDSDFDLSSCTIATSLPAGASDDCIITEAWAAGQHTNTATASGSFTDDANTKRSVSATDDANYFGAAPAIEVTKTASPTSVPETGGNVTFTFVVLNTSASAEESVTITSLSDSDYDLSGGDDDCKLGTVLAAGASCEFSIIRWVEGDFSGPDHENIFTATAVDDYGTKVSDSDNATVTFSDVAPAIRVTKTADPTEVPETGGDVTFTFLVENIGQEDVTLTELVDTEFDDLDGKGTCDVPQTILIGDSYSCEYTVNLKSDSLTAHTNVVTATAVDDDGTRATDEDDETVTFSDVAPDITVTKTASPTSVPETGGNVTFTFLVENIGQEDVTLTTLSDTKFGDLDGKGTCATGGLIPVGGSYSCTYTVVLASDSLTAHYNVVTAVGTDDDNTTDIATDNETVTFSDVLPDITVTKTASPTSVPETGGNVVFTFVVKNNGAEAATISSLSDSVYGVLDGDADCKLGTVLAAGASCEFAITRFVSGDYSGPDHENVFTGKATDNDGNTDEDSDDETVVLTDVLPDITVTKTANPTSVPETGGNVTFTFVVTNNSAEAAEITDLDDDKFAPLTGDADCEVGTVLAGKASCSFSILRFVAGDFESGIDHVNTFTATAADNDGNEDTATDNATVTFTDVTASIDIEKYVSVDGGATWQDADSAPGPYLVAGTNPRFKFVVTNTGNVALSNVSVTDTKLTLPAGCIVTTLAVGASDDCIVTGTWAAGQHTNTATATGSFTDGAGNTESDSDSDSANYYGLNRGQPSISINSLSININATRTSVSGQFSITDESTGAKSPDGFMVALTEYGVTWQQKGSGKNSRFADVIPTGGCTYKLVSLDGTPLNKSLAAGQDVIFDETVTIGYTCTFGSSQLTRGGTLKGTASASIFGRPDRIFTYSSTATIPR